jgi:predicted DNA-binding transcriptional regulator AlpA
MTRSINTPEKALLNLADVLRLTGLSDPTWRLLVATDKRRTMPQPVALPGRRKRYLRSDVLAWLESLRRE